DFVLAETMHIDAVVPVNNVLIEVAEAHVLAQVIGALLGRFQETVLSRQHVGRREAVDQARYGVSLLAVMVLWFLAGQGDRRPIVTIVDLPALKLGRQVELTEL